MSIAFPFIILYNRSSFRDSSHLAHNQADRQNIKSCLQYYQTCILALFALLENLGALIVDHNNWSFMPNNTKITIPILKSL